MEHGHANPPPVKTDPGDFVAEEARIQKAKPNYVGVFIVLGIFTAIEIGLVELFPETIGRVPMLLFLTVAKGLLVVLYYMHLKFDSRIYSFFFGAGVFAFAVPFVLALILLMSPPHLQGVREASGEGGERPAARPTANPNAGPPITFNTEAGEFYFKPEALSANAGQAVNVVMTNVGSVEHTFVVPTKNKAEEPEPWVTRDGKVVAKAAPGASGKGGFIAPGPGEYVFYCNIPGHAEAGMYGTLSVR